MPNDIPVCRICGIIGPSENKDARPTTAMQTLIYTEMFAFTESSSGSSETKYIIIKIYHFGF